jgi:peptidoglycan/xylan/chitin deacetylase (PgdA/CDA1 family)
MYHRIADVPTDPFSLCVSPERFTQHLAILKQYCHPMSLQQFVQAMQKKRLPKRAVVITFDDGYADNLYAAKPLLEHHQIPATVFISTGYLTSTREAWWDELAKILLQPGSLPAQLQLKLGDQTAEWDLGDGADYSEAAFQRDRTWNWHTSQDPTTRQRLYRELYDVIHPLSPDNQQQIMDQLLAWAGLDATPRSNYRFLTPSEVPVLTQGGLIEVGAHTMTHPMLTTLSRDRQHDEIVGSKQKLETLMGQPLRGFAYPHGNYNAETVSVVQEAGFDYACTTRSWHVRFPTNDFEIPRIAALNWEPDAFKQEVLGWL